MSKKTKKKLNQLKSNSITLKDPRNKNLSMKIEFLDGVLTFNRVEKVVTPLNPLNTNPTE